MRARPPSRTRGDSPAATVVVERLAAGGDGVGRLGGKVIFLPLTAPGDVAEVRVESDRRTWCRGRVLRLVTASAHRVEPPCPAFGVCGGCSWQHVSYPEQLAAKRSILEEALRRIGRLEFPPPGPVAPSPRIYGYRHRARLSLGRRGRTAVFGFFRQGTHEVVPLARCPVLRPELSALLPALSRTARRLPGGFLRCTEVRLDADWEGRRVRVALRAGDGAPLRVSADLGAALREEAGSSVELLFDETVPLRLGPGEEDLVTTGASFTQVNLEQNQALVRLALELAAPAPGESVLDLYCGLGNLSLPASRRGARVTGVDLDAAAIRQAEANSLRLGLAARFLRADASAEAAALAAAGRRFDLVLLNPPRAGARETAAHLPALRPSRILVVSCDPATLARDAALLAARGFRLAALRPVDLFPQTAHVETLALFLPVAAASAEPAPAPSVPCATPPRGV